METVHVRIYKEDKDRLGKLAEEMDMTTAEYLHNLIENNVNTNNVNIEKLEPLSKELGLSESDTLELAVNMLVNGKI